jgi:hypothetical protein
MKLPTVFTKQTNADISKTIKSLLTLDESSPNTIIENQGFSFMDLARSLNAIRPTGKMTFRQLTGKKAVINSAKRFVKIYS